MEKAAQVGKGGAQECRDLLFGDQMEQQRAQTGAQQRGGNAQAGEQRHQHRGTKHSKHVLHTQDQHPSGAQLSSVVYALGVIDLFTHGFVYLLRQPKKRGIAVVNGSAS